MIGLFFFSRALHYLLTNCDVALSPLLAALNCFKIALAFAEESNKCKQV